MSFDVERGLISKLLQEQNTAVLKDLQLKYSYFTGENKNAYNYMMETIKETGALPTVRAFERKFPNYKLDTVEIEGKVVVGTEENARFWVKELRQKVKHNTLVDMIENVSGKLEKLDTDTAYDETRKQVAFIESEVVETTDVDITQNVQERIDRYKRRRENKGMIGIPTGFKHLDYLTKGYANGTLTTVIGRPGVGKSWQQIISGAYCMLNNYRVLQFVTEMSEEIMQDRYDAILYAMCYGNFNYAKFKSGDLDPQLEKSYFQFLENDMPNFEPLIIATATGVIGVEATIEKYKPDIVFIDSAYLMEDDQRAKDDWLRVTHITRDLKKLSKRLNLPIVINSQADKSTSKKSGPDMNSISYAQSIGQDSDLILAVYRDDVMLNDKEMGIKILKQREGTLGKVLVTWNFSNMQFKDIYMEADSSQETEDNEESGEQAKDNTLSIDSI